MATTTPQFDPIVSIVGFHHARGPEIECWIGVEDEGSLSEWPLLPFMALSDGAHSLDSSSEDFSYFTLKHVLRKPDGTEDRPVSLFGISCTRQLDSSTLIRRPHEVTRSTVQKAVVVIADSPVYFGGLKEKLGMVTRAWFAQRNFEDLDIIRKFQESLKLSLSVGSDQYLGLSLRELVFEFRQQTLVLFKCCLLQPKMLFFGSRCDRLCMTQFSLLSLIPGLLGALEDCADPELNYYEGKLFKPTSVKTSDRKSLLTFMGMPLQIFGKGSLFGPYTPLQQLDILADVGTKSYVVGSTNSLLLQQKDRYSDILINLDELSVNITSSSLRTALYLTAADRRWIDSIVQAVAESWDENDPSRPNTMGFVGSEDYIRLQFEEYALSMVSSVKCHDFLQKYAGSAGKLLPDVEGDPALDFGMDFIDMWKKTENYRIFQKFTDSELFDLVPPKHVMAGGLTMDDVSRRISQQLNELKLDEKMVNGREAVAKTLVAGRGKLGAAFSTLTSNVASLRETQTKKLSNPEPHSPTPSITPSVDSSEAGEKPAEPPQPAKGGYFSAWASWAGEKKRKAFGGTPAQTPSSSPPMKATSNSETTSAAPSIGSPKVSVKKAGRDSYAEDIYDAETGIGKGDSGFISPPYRASLDMHPHVQAQRNGEVGDRTEPEPSKGLFSVIAEQFQMVDIRKSLPPPPLPEKEPLPEIPEKSEEDREFLRNLRKSLPPPPSEIDFLPDILVTPGPPPGPLIAQEALDESILQPVVPNTRPLSRELQQTPAGNKSTVEVLPQVEEQPEGALISEEPIYRKGLPEVPAHTMHVLLASPKTQEHQEAQTLVNPPEESRTARFKAQNLINQYVAEAQLAILSIEQADEKTVETPVKKSEEKSEGILEEKIEEKAEEKADMKPEERPENGAEKDPEMSVEVSPEPMSQIEPVVTSQVQETMASPPRASRTARLKARNLLRQYVAQENETQLRASSVVESTLLGQLGVEESPKSTSMTVDVDAGDAKPLVEEWPAQKPKTEEPRPARSKARGLIRKYVAQEQEAEQETELQRAELEQWTKAVEPTPDLGEHYEPGPIQRSRTRTLSQGESMKYSPTIPRTSQVPVEPLKRRFTRGQTPEPIPEPIKRIPTAPQTPEAAPETVIRTPTFSMDSLVLDHSRSQSKSIVSEDSPRVFKRKSIPAFSTNPVPVPEAESPTREDAAEPLKISKRRSTIKPVEDIIYTTESPEVTIQMKRKSLRSIGGDYASLEASLKEKEKEKEREKEQEREREIEIESAKERERLREIERGREREREIEKTKVREIEVEKAREREKEREREREREKGREREREKGREREREKGREREREKEREMERLREMEKGRERVSEIKKTKVREIEIRKAREREKKEEREREREREQEKEKETAPPAEPVSPQPGSFIKRRTIPAVFAQADAAMEQKPKLSRATTGVGSLPRTPSPGLSAAPDTASTTPSPSGRRIGGRSRSGTVAQGPPGVLALNRVASPPMPPLPSFKDLPKRGLRTPSPTKDSPEPIVEKTRITPMSITTRGLRAPSIDETAPPSPGKVAVAESRTGPGRVGGGLKDNPFLRNDLVSPTSGTDGGKRNRVGTLKNNPFIKNDVKSPTSPPPAK